MSLSNARPQMATLKEGMSRELRHITCNRGTLMIVSPSIANMIQQRASGPQRYSGLACSLWLFMDCTRQSVVKRTGQLKTSCLLRTTKRDSMGERAVEGQILLSCVNHSIGAGRHRWLWNKLQSGYSHNHFMDQCRKITLNPPWETCAWIPSKPQCIQCVIAIISTKCQMVRSKTKNRISNQLTRSNVSTNVI